MTLKDYRRIEDFLAAADEVTRQRSPVSARGRELREAVRALLRDVTVERVRLELAAEKQRETTPPAA